MNPRRTILLGAAPAAALVTAMASALLLECCSSNTAIETPPTSDASGGSPPCTASFGASDAGTPATITVDTAKVVNTFVPKLLFGINSAYFISQQDSVNTQAKVQAAGNFFIRYPGGSSSDDYHWNGTGSYDASQRWMPSSTAYSPGFIRYFGDGGGTNLWNMIGSGTCPCLTDPTAGDLAYLQHDVNAYRYQERAEYWAMQMMSSAFAIAGDTRTHQLVSTTASQPALAAYADLRPDGALGVVVVNEDEANAFDAQIDLGGFVPGPAADVWTFDETDYAWETAAPPYHADPHTGPVHALTCGASASTAFTFSPGSLTELRFAPPGAPTAVLPDAGTAAPSATLLIDDMSSPNGQIQLAPQHPGDIPGSWYTYLGGGAGPGDTGFITPLAQSEITDGGAAGFSYTPIGASPGAAFPSPADAGTLLHAACTSGETPAAQYAYAAEGFTFELSLLDGGGAELAYVDISAHKGLAFWAYNALTTTTVVHLEVGDKESDPDGGICGNPTDGSTLYQCDHRDLRELRDRPRCRRGRARALRFLRRRSGVLGLTGPHDRLRRGRR